MSVENLASARLPTPWGEFELKVFRSPGKAQEHLALILGKLPAESVLTRIHSECLTGEVLFSLRCDCGAQLEMALQRISQAGQGVLVYLRQEGRGIGLANKIRAYALQDQGADTVEANEQLGFPSDMRRYDAAVAIYAHLGVRSVRLMTNNPLKVEALQSAGIEVAEQLPIESARNHHNQRYLATKASKLGHRLATVDSNQG